LVLIVASMVVNYSVGARLLKEESELDIKLNTSSRKPLLILGVSFNLGLLAYFKYADFFIDNVNYVLSTDTPLLNLVLPLAISFFTFQQIAFIVDCYRNDAKEYSFLNYALFVTFFPQLIAGPIVHHKQMMPQFMSTENSRVNWNNITVGLFIFSIGLFKKVVIADTLGEWVALGYADTSQLSFFEAWGATLSYTFQLYYDFSGYTDMAIGAALLFNIHLPINFNSPYKSLSIQEFWRRWHITLSNWLRDYVYIPLGGNRLGSFRTYQNLMLTFLAGGLWHGAGWTFLIWGGLHGLALAIHRYWSQFNIKLPRLLSWSITFLFVHFTWVFFRSESYPDALNMLSALFNVESIGITEKFRHFLSYLSPVLIPPIETLKHEMIYGFFTLETIIVFAIAAFILPNSIQISNLMPGEGRTRFRHNVFYVLLMTAMTFVSFSTFLGHTSHSEFLYFNF